jgi:hypothetical protein
VGLLFKKKGSRYDEETLAYASAVTLVDGGKEVDPTAARPAVSASHDGPSEKGRGRANKQRVPILRS